MVAFLESEFPNQTADARYHVLPVPYEGTVSYGGGTSKGPDAILKASQQLEAFDGIGVPGRAGLYTQPHLECEPGICPEDVVARVEQRLQPLLEQNKVPVLLGGEHSISLGAIRAAAKIADIGVVQFDAHADLRDSYEGTPFSHACVMRRVVELGLPVFQIGVRSLSEAEQLFQEQERIQGITAAEVHHFGVPEQVLPESFPGRVYVTFDIDAFDPSVIPATGTPEPGGLSWFDALDLLERVSAERQIVGFDVVELAPIEGVHASDYTAARLVYQLIGMIERNAR